jgi:transcriptional regulator with XRE-family HTH domain
MADETYLSADLIALRKDLGLTQQKMADQLEMGLRSYQAIESGESEYRYIHRLAVERVALMLAIDKKDPALATDSVRSDAIELVRIGRAARMPEFMGNRNVSSNEENAALANNKFRAAYGIVGELVLLTTALDHQLNHILMHVLHLAKSPMLESVIATLDLNRKIEMLKARAKHISESTWRKALKDHLEKLERVNSSRNIVAHTALIPDAKHGAVFAPTAAAKLLNNLELGESPALKKTPIAEFSAKIKLAESALGSGQTIIEKFEQMNSELAKRSSV